MYEKMVNVRFKGYNLDDPLPQIRLCAKIVNFIVGGDDGSLKSDYNCTLFLYVILYCWIHVPCPFSQIQREILRE